MLILISIKNSQGTCPRVRATSPEALTPVGKHHQISEAHHAETSHVIFLQLSRITAPPFPCLAQVTLSQWHPQG